MKFVVCGLSITSSWGNGHATNYRALARALERRGHDLLFLERDVPWYAAHRDALGFPYARVELYTSVGEVRERFSDEVRDADCVMVGSFVPEGVAIGSWVLSTARGVTAFYDIDTPVTVAKLHGGDDEYLTPALVPRYDLYLSFTGGPILRELERRWGARRALPFHCVVDPQIYFPQPLRKQLALGYLGTYSPDRQPALETLLVEPARRVPTETFAVAGPQYPDDLEWPRNVSRIDHLPPTSHRAFYCAQRATLNVTRAEMARAGWSPSVRLFEAAACGTPVISDRWPGLDEFFVPGREIIVAQETEDVISVLRRMDREDLAAIGERARARVLAEHTAGQRVEQLESYLAQVVPVAA